MARRRRVKPGSVGAAAADHPWERPADLDEAREAYVTAWARTGGPPLARPDETMLRTARRLRGAQAQSLWAAARFDPDPDVRLSALVEAVAYVRNALAGHLERALFGPVWMRTDVPTVAPSEKVWATHGISQYTGPMKACGRAVMLALRDAPTPELVEPLRDALEAFIDEAASVGLRVERKCGGAVEPTNRRRPT